MGHRNSPWQRLEFQAHICLICSADVGIIETMRDFLEGFLQEAFIKASGGNVYDNSVGSWLSPFNSSTYEGVLWLTAIVFEFGLDCSLSTGV